MKKPKWFKEHDHGGPSVVHVYRIETDDCMDILGAVTERDGGWFWFPDLVDTQLDTETMEELLEIQKEEISGKSDYTMTVGPFSSLDAAKRCGELMGRQKFERALRGASMNKPEYSWEHHAQASLGVVQEGFGRYVEAQMKIAFQHGMERGRDDAKSEHRKELKTALEVKETEVRAELAGKQIDGLPVLREQIEKAILKVRDDVFENEDIRGYEAVDNVKEAISSVLGPRPRIPK